MELPVEAAEQELIDLPDRGARARGGAARADAAGDGALLRGARRVGRGGRSRAVPVLRWPDRRRRAPVPACQRLPPVPHLTRHVRLRALHAPRRAAGRARPDHARLQPHLPDPAGRRGRAVRLQAELGGAAAVGLHRRHPRRPGVRRLGGLRPPRLGRRPPDGAARRPRRARAWCSCGWSPTRDDDAPDPVDVRARGPGAARLPARARRHRVPTTSR